MIAVPLVLVAAGIIWYARRRGSRRVDAPRPEIRAVGWVGGIRWGVLPPLTRVETARILHHPAFLLGVPLVLFGVMAGSSSEVVFWKASAGIALGLVLLGWMTIVAANLTVLRPRRGGADELMAALPTPAPVRTSAHLMALSGPALTAVVVAVGWTALLSARRNGPIGSPVPLETATGVLIVLGGGVVGVAVANWLPRAVFGAVAVVAVILIQARFLDPTTWPWNDGETGPVRFLAFLSGPTSVPDPVLEVRHAGWHLIYLAGLIVVMVGVALARHGLPRAVVAVLACGVAVATLSGVVQTRPPSAARVDEMVSYLSQPEANQVCTDSGRARVCAYPLYADWRPDWQARVESVLALAPEAAATHALVIRQRVPTITGNANCAAIPFDAALPSEVRARFTPEAVWPNDGDIHPTMKPDGLPCADSSATYRVGGLFVGVETGAWAVGLPPAPHGRDVRCNSDGQARAVAALWLGAAGTPGGAERLAQIVGQSGTGTHLDFSDWDSPPMWGVEWSRADAAAAQDLLNAPTADVTRALAEHWSEIVDPKTPASRLMEWAGRSSTPGLPSADGSAEQCP